MIYSTARLTDFLKLSEVKHLRKISIILIKKGIFFIYNK